MVALEPKAKTTQGFAVLRVREDFPGLRQKVHGKSLVYLDSAATTQKPEIVLRRLRQFYEETCSNVHEPNPAASPRTSSASSRRAAFLIR